MANPDPSKTEQPTSKKIDEARKDGTVLMSQDVISFGVLLAGVILLFFTVPFLIDGYQESFISIFQIDCRSSWDSSMIRQGAIYSIITLAKYSFPFMFFIALFAIIITRIQTGKYFSLKALKWKASSLNPKTGFKQLLPSKKNVLQLLLTMSKVSVIGFVVYFSIKNDFEDILALTQLHLPDAIQWIGLHIVLLVFKVLVLMAIISIIDYIVKKKQYTDNLMMTKQEVKDENKQAQGDPLIKGKIRQKMRELMMSRMINEVPSASVILTNPTHVSVAIRYSTGEYAPKIVAKGLRKRALKIREIAKKHNIPIIESPPLARSLYRNIKIGDFISSEFFGAVAAILAKIQKISQDFKHKEYNNIE